MATNPLSVPKRLEVTLNDMTLPFFTGTVAVVAVLQTLPGISDALGPVERLSTVGILAIACRVLWNSNVKKDEQLIQMGTKVTEAMVEVLSAVKELRKSSDELGQAVDNTVSKLALLTTILKSYPICDNFQPLKRQPDKRDHNKE